MSPGFKSSEQVTKGEILAGEVNDVNCDSLVLKFSIDDLDRPHSFLCDIHCIPFSP